MRIPLVYYESMVKRHRKQKQIDTTDYTWIENTQQKPIAEQITEFKQCKQVSDPKYTRIVSETIDAVLECGVALFKDRNAEPCQQLLGHADGAILWELCLQCCDLICQSNSKIVDMIFSYEHLLLLIFHNPDYDLNKIQRVIHCLHYLLESMNSSKACKFKVEQFERVILRFMYVNAFFQKGIFNLSDQETQELFQLQLDNYNLSITIPCDDMNLYANYLEMSNFRKILTQAPLKVVVTFDRSGNPFEQSVEIANQLNLSLDSMLFDQIYVRLLCQFYNEEALLQLLFVRNYVFHLRSSFSELQLINHKLMTDISNRLMDQKDFLFLVVRMIVVNNNPALEDSLVEALQFMKSKQIQLFEHNTFLEKLWLFELQGIQDTLIEYKEKLNIAEGDNYEHRMHLNVKLQQLFFSQLADAQFTATFKKQPHYNQWNQLIIQILRKSFNSEGETILPQYILYPLLNYVVTLITELPHNNVNQQLEYNLEVQIVQGVIEIAKNANIAKSIQLQTKSIQLINSLVSYYKSEYDQVQIQNAQSEYLMPVPERYHKLLGEIWSNKILEDTLHNSQLNEQLYTQLITVFAIAMGENPARVRQFYENKGLQFLIDRIVDLLQVCSRASQLIVTVINLLIAISTNEQAIQLALQNNDQHENLVKRIFVKCYLPSVELLHDPTVSDDFAKKIIMLYSQSMLAKKQIEKVIENTFVTISQLVDLSKDKIEEIVSNQEKLQSFYSYSKSLQALLQLFMQLQPEKKSYRSFQGYEELALEEAQRQKDQLFNSLLKNPRFVEALEKIIMSPILIGSKNKDTYVEHYVGILCRKNKLNPYTSLWKELDLISQNYMVIGDQKIIDIGKLVDYDALSVHMSDKYFFRKIIKHISPQTYRGFYILSRFHLIHYLIKMCITQGIPPNVQDIHLMISQLLEIFFLSSQHAGFHESIMMSMAAKQQVQKHSTSYEEDSSIRRRISKDNLIPLQQSCLDLIGRLQVHATLEQKESIIRKYGEITMLFFVNFKEKYTQIMETQGIQIISLVTYMQDMLKSLKFLLILFQSVEQQFQPLQFTITVYQNRVCLINLIEMMNILDQIQRAPNNTREQEIIKKILPGFMEAMSLHVDNIIKQLVFKKILLDKVVLSETVISDPQQLDSVCNEIIISQAMTLNQMVDTILASNCEGSLKNLLEQLIAKFCAIKEAAQPDMRKVAGYEVKEQLVSKQDIVQLLQGTEARQEAQKKSLFDRPEIKQIVEHICDMGFPEKLVKKAIKRVEIPEPTMIIDMLCNGRISDDEDEQEDFFDDDFRSDNSETQMNQLVQHLMKKQNDQEKQQEQKLAQMQVVDQELFNKILLEHFPNKNDQPMADRTAQLISEFQMKLDSNLSRLLDYHLNNQKQSTNLLEYLFTIAKKQQHVSKILEYIFNILKQDTNASDLNVILVQFTKALSWMGLLQAIAPQEHERIYQHLALVDQEPPKESKFILSFQQMIRIGFALSERISIHLHNLGAKEQKCLQELQLSDTNYNDLQSKISEIVADLNVTFENKQNTIKLFCKELQEACKYLTKFVMNLSNTHDELIPRYWNQIEIYLQFLIQISTINLELQEMTIQTQTIIESIDIYVTNNPALKQQRDALPNATYFKSLIQKRFYSDKQIIIQLLMALNSFGVHNQAKLFKILTQKQNKRTLIDILLNVRLQINNYEYEESQPVYLENLLYLIATDSKTMNELLQNFLRQVILNEHCDWYAQQLRNADELVQINLPSKYIEAPLHYLLSTHPVLINNPIVYNMIIEQQGLSITDKFSELQRVHAAKPVPTGKLTKEQEKQLKEREQQTDLVIRFEIESQASPSLNEDFLHILNIIAQITVDRFFEDNVKLIEQIHNITINEYKEEYKLYLYGWDQLLRIIEMLIIKIPQLVLHLRTLEVQLPTYIGEKTTFIRFIVKYLSWVGGDKLANFMHNYLCDINLLSCGYGVTVAQEVFNLLLQEIEPQSGQQQLQKYYHILQVFVLLIQTLTLQHCSLLLTDQRSQLNVIPKLIASLDAVNKCDNPQFIRLYSQTLSKIIEPFLQAQVYHEHLRNGRFGEVFRLQESVTNPFHYHYLHCLRNQLLCYSVIPNYKSISGSAQHFISLPQAQCTLKDDYQQEFAWPLYQSRKNYGSARQNNQKQQEEDVSDSDSDQDIVQPDPVKFKANYPNQWGSDYYFENNDFVNKYSGRGDEERMQRDNAQNMWPQKDLNIQLCKLSAIVLNFKLPELQVTKTIQYDTTDYKQWITSLVGLYYSSNEYFESKKQYMAKAYENQLKITVEYINQITRLLISSNYYRNKQPETQQYLSYYLNGQLNHLQIYSGSSCFYSKFGQAPNQLQQDYQANQLPINPNDSQLHQQRILSQISCTVLQSRVVLNGMPSDLQDQGLLRAKLQSLLHSEEIIVIPPSPLQVPPVSQHGFEDPTYYDDLMLNMLKSLLLDQGNFSQFPFNLVRQISKCPRLGIKLLLEMLVLFKEERNNLDVSLKLLYLVSQKILQNNLRNLLSNSLEISPTLNRREKANLARVQQMKEQFVVEIEEEENADEQLQCDEVENPIMFLINQINVFCEKNVCFMKLFHNSESYIPLEKNILITPLLAKQTTYHLNYIILIIRGALMATSEETKDKKKFDDEYLYKLMRRQATIFNPSNAEENLKIFDLFGQLGKTDDNHFQELIFKSFSERYQENNFDPWQTFSQQPQFTTFYKPNTEGRFQAPQSNLFQMPPPQPPQPPHQQQPQQPALQPIHPIPPISMLQQQQQQLQQFQQIRQQHQQLKHAVFQISQEQEQLQQLQQQQKEQIKEIKEEEESPVVSKRKVSAKIAHVEIDIITALCRCLDNSLLREGNANEIINILNTYVNDKLKIEHAINELTKYIIHQAKIFNFELDKKRKQLREITHQREKVPDYDPESKQYLTNQENEIIKELNLKTPDPSVIQRCFIAITGFLNMNVRDASTNVKAKPSSNQTRAQIQLDKKKHKLSQQGKINEEQPECDGITKKEIRKKFINVLQTRQTHHLWLNVVETLLLMFSFRGQRSLDLLQKKLYPLLECFLKLYQNVYEESNEQSQQHPSETNFFERTLSGSSTNSLQFGLLQASNIHLKRSFSAVRNENEMQMKIDELFAYLCINGKRVINYLISQKLHQITLDVKSSQSSNPIKLFKETDPLGFVFFKMSQIVSFENKKHFFELDLEALRNSEKPESRDRRARARPNETIELNIVRDNRLQLSLEKVLQIDKAKFRKCEIKIRYQGERGQDEGGIRKEWMTNLVKDILQTDKFELTTKRFYKINPNKKSPEDLNHFKLLGKIVAKSIYDGLLLPVYFIVPIYKLILQKRPNFDDLEHYNEGYYDTFLKFMNEDTHVQYSELFEFWIPEEYAELIDQQKKYIFQDLLQEYLDKNPIEVKQEQGEQKGAIKQELPKSPSVGALEQPLLKQEEQQKQQQKDKDQQQKEQQKVEQKNQQVVIIQEAEIEEEPKQKKQSEDITQTDLENREKKRAMRKNKKKQLNEETLKLINLLEILSKLNTEVPVKYKRLICEVISKRIMLDEIKTQIQHLRDGFFDILPKEYFQYMDWRDLQKLIIGVPSVDVDDLQANTEYVNYDKNNQTVLWFWEVLKTLSDSEKADFLMFATGSPLVPFGGFKNLRGPNGPRKFSISKDFNQEHFIKAHACFNRIDLPEYNSKEIVREKLLKSLKESGSGFDLS